MVYSTYLSNVVHICVLLCLIPVRRLANSPGMENSYLLISQCISLQCISSQCVFSSLLKRTRQTWTDSLKSNIKPDVMCQLPLLERGSGEVRLSEGKAGDEG